MAVRDYCLALLLALAPATGIAPHPTKTPADYVVSKEARSQDFVRVFKDTVLQPEMMSVLTWKSKSRCPPPVKLCGVNHNGNSLGMFHVPWCHHPEHVRP